jgi:hypothetical protein
VKTYLLTVEDLSYALNKSWSLESSFKWNYNNPACGQCGGTSLVINDLLGGEILKTLLPQGWHFYNIIQGVHYDFIASQFVSIIVYEDRRSS